MTEIYEALTSLPATIVWLVIVGFYIRRSINRGSR